MAAASSSSGLCWKYDVFVNFRGEDTRRGFVSHLYRALRQKSINTFIDAEELRKGDHLSELLTAIRESRLSIVVFSQNYASSTWCLKELVQILECNDNKNQIVVPIFYQVDPSDIRRLKGNFAEGFAKHERHSDVDAKEVQSWRSALARATDLSGWDLRNYKDDAELIEEIVEDVFRKLIHISSTSSKDNGLVGMDSHMHEMHLRLHLDPPGVELDDVRVVGICGVGGLGKTTIARAVYVEIACQFEACCFLENVKEGFKKHGKLHMQTQLLSSISGNKVGSSNILNEGFQVMLKSHGQRKVLVVVDDVDELGQIEALLGKQHSFGGGSRIIITTRDVQLLSVADAIYMPEIFSEPRALELFRLYAFRTNQPTIDYDDLSRRVIQYAQGLPLALKVLGAFLDNKTACEWEDVLEKIRKIHQRGIHDVLKTSFDGLDDIEKNIFLDIACFFKGMEEDHVTEILDSCGFYPRIGIRVLINRALITVSWEGKLEMHDSLEEMGREIVRQESIKEPGRRSRLWSYEDVHHVLTQRTATKAVESMILDLSNSDLVFLNTEAFVSMTQLRLLKISFKYYIFTDKYFIVQHLIGPLEFLSRELRCLSWLGFPLKSLPSNFQFKKLVHLDMRFSLIDRLWEGAPTLGKLKFINLSYCQYLKETPDFTNVLNLEMLILQSCMSLIEIHQSISTLTNLLVLNLNGCKKLKILASNIRMKSLKTLDLSGCSSLEMFPEISEVMEELSALNLSGSKIKELPSSINNLTGLSYLDLKDCKELKSLPSSICQLKSLTYVTLSGCTKFEVFPSIEENMEGLRELHLDGTSIKELSPSIERLQGLELLNLSNCKSLVHLPDTLCNLARLLALNISGCSNLSQLPVDLVRLWNNAVETDNLHTDVLTRVKHSQSSSTSSKDNGLVGMDSHMREMHLLLHPPGVETNGVRVVGIWGMGGLGKTTIARAIYDEIACRFEACCFLENVKEVFKKHGELHMQTQLLSSISGNKVGSSDILNKGFEVMLKSLGKRKVLVVLDDVDELAQIKALLGEQHSFGGGSRILITTRDVKLLSGADAIYKPKIFSDRGALELFRRYAFRKNRPTRDYDDLSRRAIKYAQGLPLALKVLGAFLNGKTVREWEYVLEKLREVPLREINDVLRTSFDGLDDTEKDIFLDIACFFKGMKKDYAIEILDSCGFNPHIGIRVLIDRGLITVSGEGELKMHALVEEMGREIVRQECIQEPGRRSRLWSYEDVHHVLTQNTATEAVESIILDLSNSDEVWLNAEAFVSMTQLRLLKINHAYCKLHLIGHLKFLSRKLRCLSWLGFPFKSLPSYCQFKNLVDLDMRYSLINRLWEGTQTLEKLKFINLSYSQYLKETPDFTKVPNLEKLILQSCTSLIEVHPSLWTLTNLVLLNLNGCEELKILANSIHMKSLKILDLSGCSSLEMFPEILEVMEELSELNLSRSKIKELPSSINNLTGLSYLNLKDCKELKRLPDTLCNLAHLVHLNVSGCTNLSQLPVNLRI